MAQCKACQNGPSGAEGHTDLYVHTMGPGQMHFVCRTCGQIWVRRYAANQAYEWSLPAGEHPGATVPRR